MLQNGRPMAGPLGMQHCPDGTKGVAAAATAAAANRTRKATRNHSLSSDKHFKAAKQPRPQRDPAPQLPGVCGPGQSILALVTTVAWPVSLCFSLGTLSILLEVLTHTDGWGAVKGTIAVSRACATQRMRRDSRLNVS